MRLVTRFTLWALAGLTSLLADVLTKAAPHPMVVNNHAHTHPLVFFAVGGFLGALGLWHSRTLAFGSGLMFGGLCGNAGQLILEGYATDWIPVGGWLTNVADISGAAGLLCCFTGYAISAINRQRPPRYYEREHAEAG